MIAKKERVTITLDPHLLDAGSRAVAEGRAESLSGWINLALAERTAKEQRMAAVSEAIAAYEERFGEITAEEIAQQHRADRKAAAIIRGTPPQARRLSPRSRVPARPGRRRASPEAS